MTGPERASPSASHEMRLGSRVLRARFRHAQFASNALDRLGGANRKRRSTSSRKESRGTVNVLGSGALVRASLGRAQRSIP